MYLGVSSYGGPPEREKVPREMLVCLHVSWNMERPPILLRVFVPTSEDTAPTEFSCVHDRAKQAGVPPPELCL